MKKHISFLLVQIIVFGISNNIGYSMEKNLINSVSKDYNALCKKNDKLNVYYSKLISEIPGSSVRSYLCKGIIDNIRLCCSHLKNYLIVHSKIYDDLYRSFGVTNDGSIREIETSINECSNYQGTKGDIKTLEYYKYYYLTNILKIENFVSKHIIEMLTGINDIQKSKDIDNDILNQIQINIQKMS